MLWPRVRRAPSKSGAGVNTATLRLNTSSQTNLRLRSDDGDATHHPASVTMWTALIGSTMVQVSMQRRGMQSVARFSGPHRAHSSRRRHRRWTAASNLPRCLALSFRVVAQVPCGVMARQQTGGAQEIGADSHGGQLAVDGMAASVSRIVVTFQSIQHSQRMYCVVQWTGSLSNRP